MRRSVVRGGLFVVGAVGAVAAAGYYTQRLQTVFQAEGPVHVDLFDPLPSRQHIVNRLSRSTRDNPFDVLIIGGGATGAGCALDAATRGLDTALIEQADFGAATSSRSTKLVHGGVRYLEKAVFNLDPRQLKLVFEALQEREIMLRNAPHLAHSLPILTPCYKWWEVPYYWAGLKMYDLVAGVKALTWSHYVSPRESLRQFPTLSPTHDGGYLKGGVVYYDGQFDDARYNVSLAITAALAGGAVANYTKAVKLIKDGDGRVIGVRARDQQTHKEYDIYARVVINATGPFSDNIRHLSDASASNMIQPSGGAHVTLPDYYAAGDLGMIVPKTKDGRVVFMLPWQGHTVAGTTDAAAEISMTPQATESEVQFILDAIAEYLAVKVQRSDVLSVWCGIRPLAVDPTAADTANVVRDHVIVQEPDGLLTVTGGKWTTYRKMAEETIDTACSSSALPYAKPCVTKTVRLVGSAYWYPTLYTEMAQKYKPPGRSHGVDSEVARHVAACYGDRSQEVVLLAHEKQLAKRLVPSHPILEAEVVWAVQNEFCETPEDFLARRTRLAFVDKAAAEEALPRVAELMAKYKGWGYWRKSAEIARAKKFLATFDAVPSPAVKPHSVAPAPLTTPTTPATA